MIATGVKDETDISDIFGGSCEVLFLTWKIWNPDVPVRKDFSYPALPKMVAGLMEAFHTPITNGTPHLLTWASRVFFPKEVPTDSSTLTEMHAKNTEGEAQNNVTQNDKKDAPIARLHANQCSIRVTLEESYQVEPTALFKWITIVSCAKYSICQ